MFKRAGIRIALPLLLFLCGIPRAHALYSYAEVNSTLRDLAARAPIPGGARLQVVPIGSTVKGREILMAVLSASADPDAPSNPADAPAQPASPAEPAAQPSTAPATSAAPTVVPEADGTLTLTLEPVADAAAKAPATPATSPTDVPAAAPAAEPAQTQPGDLVLTPAAAAPSAAKKLLIICRQHGNEPASTEGAMQFLKEYATTEDPAKLALLRRVTILMVPMLNADGAERYERRNAHNVDLNRDWLSQSQPETRTMTRVVADWRPDMIVDAHELATSDWTASFAEAMEPAAGTSEIVGEYCNEAIAAIVGPLRAQSMRIYARPVFNYREPRLAHRYFSVRRGVPSVLIETHRAGGVALEDRAALHYAAFTSIARYVAGDNLGTPRNVIEAWVEPNARSSFRAARSSGDDPEADVEGDAADRGTQLASRGGNAQSVAARRAALKKKLAAQKKAGANK